MVQQSTLTAEIRFVMGSGRVAGARMMYITAKIQKKNNEITLWKSIEARDSALTVIGF